MGLSSKLCMMDYPKLSSKTILLNYRRFLYEIMEKSRMAKVICASKSEHDVS